MAFYVRILLHNGKNKHIKYSLSEIRQLIRGSPSSGKRRLIPVEPWILDNCLEMENDIQRIDIKKGKFNG